MCRPRGATREELTFKRDGAVATTDKEFDDWNSSISSLSLSPTLQYNKMKTTDVSRKVTTIVMSTVSYTNNRKLICKMCRHVYYHPLITITWAAFYEFRDHFSKHSISLRSLSLSPANLFHTQNQAQFSLTNCTNIANYIQFSSKITNTNITPYVK